MADLTEWLTWDLEAVSLGEAALRIAVAGALGLMVGLDREMKDKPIGLRAYMLVSIGAAAFAMVSLELATVARDSAEIGGADVSRLVQGLVGALGFLGAGAIIQSQDKVVGTATAAGIWTVGAIGLACGFGYFGYAVLAAVAAFLVLAVGGYIRARLRDDVSGKFMTEEREKEHRDFVEHAPQAGGEGQGDRTA